MTTPNFPPDAGAVLVYADQPPDLPDERFVDISHGMSAAFDGSRHYVPIYVSAPECRRIYDQHETAAITAAAKTHFRKRDVGFLRLGNRVRLRDIWSTNTVGTIERRLAATARREGGTLVTWTGERRRPAGGDCYDAVIR